MKFRKITSHVLPPASVVILVGWLKLSAADRTHGYVDIMGGIKAAAF
jgi:hypothetical protein